ncbi:hypothetical protein [Streptomyces hydrogenans]|uniref:hypothetical protein n=1 Tax=Streptomyces hydrogenans TaxID=1873719 RepID=UPI00167CECF0|nr:hypothetical protein [Streptomyces hydrogenans]
MHYWQQFKLRDEVLEVLRLELLGPRESKEVPEAFHALLRSGDADAVCVAINYYSSAASSVRFGGVNRFDAEETEVLERARAVLRNELNGDDREGGGISEGRVTTALSAIVDLVEPTQDTQLVLKALSFVRSEEGLESAGYAAARVLEVLPSGGEESESLIAALALVAFDESIPHRSRWPALGAIGMSPSPTAVNWLLQALNSGDIEIQAIAGTALAEMDMGRFRPLLERTVATWPEVREYPAYQFLELLREG